MARTALPSTRSIRGSEAPALRVTPELTDPVGSLQVGEHQEAEQLGAGSRPEGVKSLTELTLELLQVHGIGR